MMVIFSSTWSRNKRWIVKCTGWIMNMSVAPDGKSVGDKSEFMQKPFRIYS